jgi:hypothetical protein
MGAVTIGMLVGIDLSLLLVSGAFFNLWQDQKRRHVALDTSYEALLSDYRRVASERDELLRQKERLTQSPQKPQDKPKVLSGAAARQYADQLNAAYFSADRKKPNSEVMKENAGG